ncbi:MAG: restriction endonuclease [Oscillospiraceae bacterium]
MGSTTAGILILWGIIAVVIIGLVAYVAYSAALKKEFMKKYGVTRLPDKISVGRNKGAAHAFQFRLQYPSWAYSNKDGTADKRRSSNLIQWGESLLYLPEYRLTARRPYALIELVRMLRWNGHGVKMCQEERAKYDRLLQEKSRLAASLSLEQIIDSFRDNPIEFESYCADLYRKMGYAAKVTQATNDGGYDILLARGRETAIVECKCYNPRHSIGRPAIQKLVGANSAVGASRMIFITTSKFSNQAAEYAVGTSVDLVDGVGLLQLLREHALADSDEVTVDVSEWQLTVSDMRAYVPKDIFDTRFPIYQRR